MTHLTKRATKQEPSLPEQLRQWLITNCRDGELVTRHFSDMVFVISRSPKGKARKMKSNKV